MKKWWTRRLGKNSFLELTPPLLYASSSAVEFTSRRCCEPPLSPSVAGWTGEARITGTDVSCDEARRELEAFGVESELRSTAVGEAVETTKLGVVHKWKAFLRGLNTKHARVKKLPMFHGHSYCRKTDQTNSETAIIPLASVPFLEPSAPRQHSRGRNKLKNNEQRENYEWNNTQKGKVWMLGYWWMGLVGQIIQCFSHPQGRSRGF